MRTVKITVLTLALLVGLSRAAPAAILSGLTNWGGAYVLSLIQGSVNGKVTAQKISGNPVTGVTFQDFAITDPQGRIFLTAQELQIRLSLASLPTFHLDLGNITLVKPQIFLQRQAAGPWNFSRLIKETPQSPQPPGLGERVTKVFLREIQLGNLAIVSGELIVNDAGVTRRYPHLDLKSSLSLKNLGTAKLDVAFKVAELGLSTPQGPALPGRPGPTQSFQPKAGRAHRAGFAGPNLPASHQAYLHPDRQARSPAGGGPPRLLRQVAGALGPVRRL